MLQFFRKYSPYLIPICLGILLIVALFRPPLEDINSAAHRLDNFIADAQNQFDRIDNGNTVKAPSAEQQSIPLFLFDKNDSLLSYTDNSIFPIEDSIKSSKNVAVNKLKNGWYLQLKRKTKEGNILIGLVTIRHEYRFENKFLKNEFNERLSLPSTFYITETPIAGSVAVHSREGAVLFSIYADVTHTDNSVNIALILVYLLILLMLCYYLHSAALNLAKSRGAMWGLAFLAVSVLLIRYGMIVLKIPADLYRLDIFNPTLYGSTLFAESLGDLLLSCAACFWLCTFYYGLDTRFSLSLFPTRWRQVELVFLIALQYVGTASIFWLFRSLVMDSVISFEVYNILSINIYSAVGLLCITLLLLCHFVLSINAFRRLLDLEVSIVLLVFVSILSGIGYLVFFYDKYFWESLVFSSIWTVFFGLIGFRIFKYSTDLRSNQNILTFILLYSILSMFLIENIYERKERSRREFLANKLLTDHDYIAEFTYDDIEQRIATDKVVKATFYQHPKNRRDLHDRISSLYFSGYFSKYNIRIFTYDTSGVPLYYRDTVPYVHFREVFDSCKAKNFAPDLVFVNDSVSNSSYLSIIPIQTDSVRLGLLALYLSPKIYNGQNVYPELLLGQKITSSLDNTAYNFAIYHNDRLVVQHGDFPYSYYWDKKMDVPIYQHRFIETDDWEHLVCKYPNNRSVIVSISQEGFFEPIATISYFFLIYFILASSIIAFINLFKFAKTKGSIFDEISLSFRARINYSMLAIIIVSFVIIGLITISFFRNQYDNFYTDRLQRKEKAILTSLEYYIQENYDADKIDAEQIGDMLSLELVKIADIHNTDINIFKTDGELATSSQLSIFDNGFVSKMMNPHAYHKLAIEHDAQFTQQEHIGKLNYTSTYAPIRNKAGSTIAYLNVPYFEKSKSINDEVSSFLVTLMNAYVFLLLCAAVMAFFIANSITRPLRFISEKLRILNLNKKNEPIEWRSQDEIGTLISEYNKMIAALESSATKLAKSERESAWREMARQIAHEIKNPLTPMKLSIQYLQRAIDEGKPNVDELAKKVNKTLIEQIDNLSAIATAFSTFAQMPKSQNEGFDLNELLRGVVALFEKEDNVKIVFHTYKESATIFTDKNQMISVFNNLIKNAIQSVPEGKEVNITVVTLEEHGNIKAAVMDNGVGIDKDDYDKVFVPNFTTKSSGTGLGLAICKQIVESSRGHIWFESVVNEGTSFYITIPYYSEA